MWAWACGVVYIHRCVLGVAHNPSVRSQLTRNAATLVARNTFHCENCAALLYYMCCGDGGSGGGGDCYTTCAVVVVAACV